METINENFRVGVVSRAVAFAMALATTAFITTATVVIFTGSTQAVGAQLVSATVAPLRSLFGV